MALTPEQHNAVSCLKNSFRELLDFRKNLSLTYNDWQHLNKVLENIPKFFEILEKKE